MMRILQLLSIDDKDIRIIASLYRHQTHSVGQEQQKKQRQLLDKINIKKDVHQFYTMSPMIFNLYLEKIFNEPRAGGIEGININGIKINNFRCADDTLLIINNSEWLKNLINQLMDNHEQFGLKLNIKKTTKE